MLTLSMFIDPIADLFGSWSSDITIYSIIFRVFLAVIFGGLIGLERTVKHQVAGMRTYILVCLGSAVAMCINQFISDGSDSARLGAGVITGIGFIGAGTILVTSRNQIRGLTTAAAIWAVGSIGLAIGIGFYTIAVVAEACIAGAIIILPLIESRIQKNTNNYVIHIELKSRPDLKTIIDYLRANNFIIKSVEYDSAFAATGLSVYTLSLISQKNENKKHIKSDELLKTLNEFEFVHFAELQ